MNSTGFAGMLAAGCGLLGFGCVTVFHFDQVVPSEEKSSFTTQSISLHNSPAALSFADKIARTENDASLGQELQQALDSKATQEQDEKLNRLLSDWTNESPLSAARFVRGMPSGILRDKALRILAQTWGAQGPDEALNWSAALTEQSERDVFLTNLCLGLAQKNPRAAVRMALQNDDEEEGLLQNLTQQWAEKETPAAFSWVMQLPQGQTRDQLLERIAFVESKTNPAQAAGWVVHEMQPGPTQTETAISVVHQWAERDWNGAAAWVGEFPEGPLRERAVTELNGIAQN